MPARKLLLTILLGGLLAGLGTAVFHTIVTEPIIDQAITLEEMRHTDEPESEPVVSRDDQKKGLFVGWAALGFTWATLLGGIYSLGRTRRWLGADPRIPLFLAVVGFCVFALVPGLKYPANPPGVGSPETIDFRQQMFVASWVLGVMGALMAAMVAGRLSSGTIGRVVIGVSIYAAWSVALFIALPANPDPITMPMALVSEFRVRSLLGLALFWVLLGVAFSWSAGRQSGAPVRLSSQPIS